MAFDWAIVPLVIIELLQERDEQSRVDCATGQDGMVRKAVLSHCQPDQNGQPSGLFGRGPMHESSGAAMDGRTVFPALTSTNHRFELVRGHEEVCLQALKIARPTVQVQQNSGVGT